MDLDKKTSQRGFARCDAKPMPRKCHPDANQMPRGMRSNATQDANKMPHTCRGYVAHTCMPEGILGYSSPSAVNPPKPGAPMSFCLIWKRMEVFLRRLAIIDFSLVRARPIASDKAPQSMAKRRWPWPSAPRASG